MHFFFVKFLFLSVVLWNLAMDTNGCKKGKPAPVPGPGVKMDWGGPPVQLPPQDPFKACLAAMGITDPKVLTDGIQKADLRCIVKNAWTQDDCSAQQFTDGKSKLFIEAFGHKEPELQPFKIDPSCTTGGEKGKGYFLVLWFCLEFCEMRCAGSKEKDEVYLSAVSCKKWGDGTGCNEHRICGCQDKNGKDCGDSSPFQLGAIIGVYKDYCLNCYYNRMTAAAGSLSDNICVPGTTEAEYMENPHKAFKDYVKWKNTTTNVRNGWLMAGR